jgi:hypothetical protein
MICRSIFIYLARTSWVRERATEWGERSSLQVNRTIQLMHDMVVPAHECSSNPSRRRRSSTSFNHQQFKRRCSSSPRFLSGSRPRAPAANDLPSFSLSTSAAHHCTRLRPSLYLLPVVHVLTLYFLFVAFGSTCWFRWEVKAYIAGKSKF